MDMRLIDAHRLIMRLNDWQLAEGCAEGWNYKKDKVVTDQERQQSIYDTIQQCIDAVMKQPTVDAEPVKHGHWIGHTDIYFWECSVCSGLHGVRSRHCPHCGAKMDGGDL